MVIFGITTLGLVVGRRARRFSDTSEHFAVLQGALLGVVGLVLAFGLSLALSRYEDRRAALVEEANAIGTTWLRAQTLPEPVRTDSLGLLIDYTEGAIQVSENPPQSEAERAADERQLAIEDELWRLNGRALAARPRDSAPRLYTETLNEMIDAQTSRGAALRNQVPNAVLFLELIGAAIALGLLAAYLAILGRGTIAVFAASFLVSVLLLITFDLDRPTRGFIEIPDDVLRQQLDSMLEGPVAAAPPGRIR